jgi:hypothetical protein
VKVCPHPEAHKPLNREPTCPRWDSNRNPARSDRCTTRSEAQFVDIVHTLDSPHQRPHANSRTPRRGVAVLLHEGGRCGYASTPRNVVAGRPKPRPGERCRGYGTRSVQRPAAHPRFRGTRSRILKAGQELRVMAHNEIQTLADVADAPAALQHNLCTLEQ